MQTYSKIKDDLYGLCGVSSTTSRTDIIAAVALSVQRAQSKFVLSYGDWSFLEQYQDRVDIPLADTYETGTVAVTQDSKTITGTGTTWTLDMEGSYFRLTNKEVYELRTFTSTTSMSLAIPYQSATDTGEAYQILKRFYNLPLNFLRPLARDAKLITPGSDGQQAMSYNKDASFRDQPRVGRPTWFGIAGNTRRKHYFSTGTVTVATSGGTSTWTISTGTLPTDIVDREVRINGEERSYFIDARTGAQTFTTYDTYYNPSDATSIATAVNYAITPKETMVVGFSSIPDQRYIFSMPYIKRLPDLIASSDISPIVLAGYEDAFVACCRAKLAEDFRTLLAAGQDRQGLINTAELAIADAWQNELRAETLKKQASGSRIDRRQVGPSWI